MSLLAVLVAVVCATGCARADELSPVKTSSGVVRGVREGDVVVYKGVPFAEPPVGALRWRAPRPARQWTGVLEVRDYKPQCSQVGPPLPTMPVEPVSEDCLYLNIWAPAAAAKGTKLPVMVYLHGGAFRFGSPSTPLYYGHKLASTHRVITVNLAYRVGPLGFLVHPELSAESEHKVSGNYALLDMIAGLRWVRDNIESFGGDPENVTLFGQSAGAWGVNKLMISPLARGLFHAAIAQSGGDMGRTRTPEGMAILRDAEKSGIAFAATLGAQSIAELRKLPAEAISSARFDGLPEIPHSNAALPIVDGYVIPGDTYPLYAAGKQADVPLLIGYNADEGAYLFKPIETAAYIAATRRTYGLLADRFLELYPASTEPESQRSQIRLAAESSFGWQAWSWARIHARTSHRKVFFYYFSTEQYSAHGAELPYVFLYEFGGGWSAQQREIGAKISTYWTNFAKTGNPNGPGLPQWPAFDVETEHVMRLGESFKPGPMPHRAEHALMDEYMNGLRPHSVTTPARLTEGPRSIEKLLSVPEGLKPGRYVFQCEAWVRTSGRIRRFLCYSENESIRSLGDAVKRAGRRARFVPATRDGENAEVYMQVMVRIDITPQGPLILVLPNNGVEAGRYSLFYTAPQRFNEFTWYAYGKPIRSSDLLMWQKLHIDEHGRVLDFQLTNVSNVPEWFVNRIEAQVKRMEFMPGYFDGKPVPMHYVEPVVQ
jgi:para-nitrobenzyl esterase